LFTVSASRLKLYTTCRAQYYDKYIARQPDPLNTSALFGSAIHKAIEYYYTKNRNPQYTFSRYMACMYDYWIKHKEFTEYEPYFQLVRKGHDILGGFPFEELTTRENEVRFSYPLAKNITIHGYIDLITTDGIVLDFKTSKRKPKDLENDMQFITYAWAYQQKYKELPKAVAWYHLRTNEYIYVDAATLAGKIDVVRNVAQTLANDTFETIGVCKSCPPWCKVAKDSISYASV
jgi:hypothetical protein